MGSGSSKEKSGPPQSSRTSSTVVKNSDPSPAKQKNEKFSNSNGRTVESVNNTERKQLNGKAKKLDQIENNNKTKSRIPEPFNESDDEGDDILRDEWRKNSINTNKSLNNRIKTWEPPLPPKEEYPETYAQKMQREHYKQEQLLRQKTIYRNPDEWEINDQLSQQSLDVGKFKDANRVMPKTDIFGPLSNNDYSLRNQDPYSDNYYQSSHNRKKSVPRYDIGEEELMADIETHYY